MKSDYYKSEAYKKSNRLAVSKYREKLKDGEEFCEACRIPVKALSLYNHNKGKKHIENTKNIVKSVIDVCDEYVQKMRTGDNIKKYGIELLYFLKNEYLDENENEILDESEMYKEPDAKTNDEKEFCSQMYSCMVMDLDNMIEEVTNADFYEALEKQRDAVDSGSRDAKQKLLNIYRRIKSPQQLQKPIKNIEEPYAPPKKLEAPQKKVEVPPIKKVEIKEEVTLDEDFPPYSKFIKASNYSKFKCLEFIAFNYQQIFESGRDLNVVVETIENENVEDYNEVYKQITIFKSDYDELVANNLREDGEEEDEYY